VGGILQHLATTKCKKKSIDNLRGAGVATVISAGNDKYTNAVGEPGCISTAVTVGSSDKQDVISSFSNMASMVKLMAPGGFGGVSCAFGANNPDILSSFAGNSAAETGTYQCEAGTSQAAPHVAGAFAAIRTTCPTATVDQILAALQNTGKPIQDTRPGGTQTKPRIQVNLALAQICVQPADLVIAKSAPGLAVAGTAFTYTVNVTNQGPFNATNVVVTDSLPAGTSFVTSSMPCIGTPLTCNIGSMANGGSTSFTITAKVSASLLSSLGVSSTTITNTAIVKGDQPDPNPLSNFAPASTLVTESADLQLVKTCHPTTFAHVGTSAVCEIQVANLGVSDAQHVIVTDAIGMNSPSFTVTGVSGAACTPATPIGPTKSTTLTCNLGTVPASIGKTIQVIFTGNNAGHVNDKATVSSTTPDPNNGNNSATGTVDFHFRGLRPEPRI
jgi:uncharacterized repeat protein (TIGR01451 family)